MNNDLLIFPVDVFTNYFMSKIQYDFSTNFMDGGPHCGLFRMISNY